MRVFIGIDIGVSGAIAVVGDDYSLVSVSDMPVITTKKMSRSGKVSYKRQYDMVGFKNMIEKIKSDHEIVRAFVEQVHAMPQQGVSSTCSFCKGAGLVEGILVGLSVPFERVLPQRWKKRFGLQRLQKKASILKAQEIFNVKIKHHGAGDAALIALFGAESILGLRR